MSKKSSAEPVVANASRYPALFQINTRVYLTALSRELGRPATLDDITDETLSGLSDKGIDWVWLLSVWETGKAGREVSRTNPEWRAEFEETLPDLREEDIAGSGFAITGYRVSKALGGDAALARLRRRMAKAGLKLMLDFVPNHTALDHPWVKTHPEYYIPGTELDLAREPRNYTWVKGKQRDLLLAHGRDPYFPGWPDTLQLNYGSPDLQEVMAAELLKIARQCDGVRCDMAMLVLPEVFEKTWDVTVPQAFWPQAIERVRDRFPDFCFMAEVYWDLEWDLQQQGFDYTYDKRLYDRLLKGAPTPIREHFRAGMKYQEHLARFLENHDEPRAATVFASEVHRAAAVLTFLAPGLRFLHQGQMEGKRKRISPHLSRGPEEPVDGNLKEFYGRLLAILRRPALRNGQWCLLDCHPAWDGNGTWENFVAFAWEGSDGERLLVAVNFSPGRSQCYLRLPFTDLAGKNVRLVDLLGEAVYDREGSDLLSRGLYLDEAPWKTLVFSMGGPGELHSLINGVGTPHRKKA